MCDELLKPLGRQSFDMSYMPDGDFEGKIYAVSFHDLMFQELEPAIEQQHYGPIRKRGKGKVRRW